MKKLLTLCLAGIAVIATAAETPISLKSKKDVTFWGNKDYYQSVSVSVADGAAKFTVEKVGQDAKVCEEHIGVNVNQPLKAGVKYKLILTLKSNMDVKVRYKVLLSRKPWTPLSKSFTAALTADTPKVIELEFTPENDISVQLRMPAMYMVLKEGQTLEISDMSLAED